MAFRFFRAFKSKSDVVDAQAGRRVEGGALGARAALVQVAIVVGNRDQVLACGRRWRRPSGQCGRRPWAAGAAAEMQLLLDGRLGTGWTSRLSTGRGTLACRAEAHALGAGRGRGAGDAASCEGQRGCQPGRAQAGGLAANRHATTWKTSSLDHAESLSEGCAWRAALRGLPRGVGWGGSPPQFWASLWVLAQDSAPWPHSVQPAARQAWACLDAAAGCGQVRLSQTCPGAELSESSCVHELDPASPKIAVEAP
jgi:hypothetical protein